MTQLSHKRDLVGIFIWLEYLRAYSTREEEGRGVAEWQNVEIQTYIKAS